MRGVCTECGTEGVELTDGRCVYCAEKTPDDAIGWVAARLHARGLLAMVSKIAAEEHAALDDVLSACRFPRVVAARHAAWRALSAMGFSSVEIGALWGMHHASVLYALGTLKGRMRRSKAARKVDAA